MRRRILSLLLLLLLCASGCTAPQNKTDEPSRGSTQPSHGATTTTDIVPNADSNGTSNTTESYSTTSINGSLIPSHSTAMSTIVGDRTTIGTVSGQSTTSKPTATHVSATDNTSSVSPATTTLPQDKTITFKATVRDKANAKPVNGVTVTVYYSNVDTTPAGSGVTDRNGVVRIEMKQGTTYKVVLSNLPAGYEAANPYSFSTNTVNITIKKSPVYNESDHSGAQYKEGDAMTNFVLTDTDGNIHRLSDLLKTKQLIILDFWYVSCEPCKTEFPIFESALKKYGDRIALLAIDPFDSARAISDLRKKLNANSKTAVSFPMMQDTCKLAEGFGATSFPTTVFVNSEGVILDIHTDAYPTESALCAAIERYLR